MSKFWYICPCGYGDVVYYIYSKGPLFWTCKQCGHRFEPKELIFEGKND